MSEKTNEVAKQMMLEEAITKSVQIPGVKVNRRQFLAEQFASKASNLEEIIEKGPIEAGIKRDEIAVLAKKVIIARTSQSSAASFVAGLPGGLAMAATIPADVLQFFGMTLRLAQELSYLYGAQDLWVDGKIDDEKVKNQLILYCGVMFGVSGASAGVRVLSTQISKTVLKKLPQQALTKTFWYPIVKKTCNMVGIHLTKKTLAQGVSKAVPIIGGVISGSINFASMMPMANRLNDALDEATFNYTEEEFEKDIEVILSVDENEVDEIEEKETIGNIVSEGFSNAKEGISKFASKFGKKKENENKEDVVEQNSSDPYEEIKKLKELLDMEIISQEEFDKKKKELLNL